MKSKPVPGSLFSLLVRNYLLFTLTLLLIAGGIFLLWNTWLDRLFRPADWSGLMADPALAAGSYERLDRYTGNTGSAFAVYDGDSMLIYTSDAGFDPICTADELACVPAWDEDTMVSTFEQTGADGTPRYLVLRQSISTGKVETVVLDEYFQVIFGEPTDGRMDYTPGSLPTCPGGGFPAAPSSGEAISARTAHL